MKKQDTFSSPGFAEWTLVAFTAGTMSTLPMAAQPITVFNVCQDNRMLSTSEVSDYRKEGLLVYETSSRRLYPKHSLQKTEAASHFLAESEEARQVLTSIEEKIVRYFGEKPLMLELVHDPELEEDGLLLSVMVESDFDSACETLRRFEDEWWFDQTGETQRLFSVDVMPV